MRYIYEKGFLRTDSGLYIDKGNLAVDVRHPDFEGGAAGDGVRDDRAAIAAADAYAVSIGAGLIFGPGDYRVASNLTVTSTCDLVPGASIVADSGVVVTYNQRLLNGAFTLISGDAVYAPVASDDVVRVSKTVSGTLSSVDKEVYDVVRTTLNVGGNNTGPLVYSGSAGHFKLRGGETTPHRGTAHAVSGNVQIFDLNHLDDSLADTGQNCEFTPFFGCLNARRDRSNDRVNLWGVDLSIHGPNGAQEGFMGYPFFLAKYNGTQTVDATHYGSLGIGVITKPGSGGGADEGKTGLTSYPIAAGILVAGYSGPVGTVTNGDHASATSGFATGVQIGGRGTPWMDSAQVSKIGNGLTVQDYTDNGVWIKSKHAAAVAGFAAIRISTGAGDMVWSDAGALKDDQGGSIKLGQNTVNNSTAAYLDFRFGDGASASRDRNARISIAAKARLRFAFDASLASSEDKEFEFLGTTRFKAPAGETGRNVVAVQAITSQTADLTQWKDAADAPILGVGVTGYLHLYEQSDPTAPAANQAKLYCRDNGAGKTQIVARFPTGAVQVLATEP